MHTTFVVCRKAVLPKEFFVIAVCDVLHLAPRYETHFDLALESWHRMAIRARCVSTSGQTQRNTVVTCECP